MVDLTNKDLTTLTFTQDELKIISAIIIQTKFSLIDAQAVTPLYNKFRTLIKVPTAPQGPQDHKKGK